MMMIRNPIRCHLARLGSRLGQRFCLDIIIVLLEMQGGRQHVLCSRGYPIEAHLVMLAHGWRQMPTTRHGMLVQLLKGRSMSFSRHGLV